LAKRASSKIAGEKPQDDSQVFARHLERAAAAIEANDFKEAESNLLTAELLRPDTNLIRPLWTRLADREARFAGQGNSRLERN
jgi:hypothetical protein